MAEQILLKPKGFRQHLENFWYHYKLHTILTLFLVAVLAIGVTQCVMRENPDYKIIVCMDKYVPDDVLEAMRKHITAYAEDVNGDGKVVVHMVDASLPDNQQNPQVRGSQAAKLQAELQMGETMLFLTDQVKFDMLGDLQVFEETDYLPDCGGRALNLKGTPFAEAVNAVYDNFISHDVYLSKRLVKGTDFEKNEVSVKNEADAVKLLRRLLEAEKPAA